MSSTEETKKKKKDKRKVDEIEEKTEEKVAVVEEDDKEKKKKAKKAKKEAEAAAAGGGEGKEAKTEAKETKETKETKEEKKAKVPRERIKGGISIIANPLAGEKLAKKVLKLVKKAAAAKSLRRGVKEVQKALRKGETGLMILAGNITPIDVITHLPVLCEEKSIPYIYVPYKEDLGEAGGTKRPTSVILITLKAGSDFADAYKEVVAEVTALAPVFGK